MNSTARVNEYRTPEFDSNDVHFRVSNQDESFEALLDALAHEGVLIVPDAFYETARSNGQVIRLADASLRTPGIDADADFDMLLEALIHEGVLLFPQV